MSENNLRPENGAPEAAAENALNENKEKIVANENENAPRQDAPEGAKKPEKKAAKPKKKRKQNGVALPLMAILLVAALIFGMAAGYGIGRSTVLSQLKEAQAENERLNAALEESMSATGYDSFHEELTEENREALDALAGEAFTVENESAALVGEDDFSAPSTQDAAEPVVVAEYDGGQLMSDEVAREYEEQMASYLFNGYDEEEIASTVLSEVMRYMVSDRLLEAHAKELGLYELTDADRAQIEEEATAHYEEHLAFYKNFVDAQNMTEEEIRGAAKQLLLESEGVTYESIRTATENSYWVQKLYDEITKDVKVDDAALKSAYDARLAEQKESFDNYPDDYELSQLNGEVILYNLSGYRAVKMLLIGLSDEEMEAVYSLTDEISELDKEADAALIAEYQAQIDAQYTAAEEKMQAALAEMRAGADFDHLIETYGTDEGMMDENIRATGYYMSKDSLLWPQELITAAMALSKAGDVSQSVRLTEGLCVLQYIGEVQAGEVPLEDVRAQLEEETLENLKYEAYEKQVDEWLEAANVKYYPERML